MRLWGHPIRKMVYQNKYKYNLFGEVVDFLHFAQKSVLATEHMNVRQRVAHSVVHILSCAYALNWIQKSLKSNLAWMIAITVADS